MPSDWSLFSHASAKSWSLWVLRRINSTARPFFPNLLGFRKGVGTEDAIASLINKISSAKNSKSRRKVTAVFIDLEKAFKLANKDSIIQAMIKAGLGGKLIGWCRDFLTNRQARVQFQGVHSNFHTFHNGTPRGSPLSPTLFNFLIDEILRSTELAHMTHMFAYADDLVIVSTKDSERSCQKALDSLNHTTDELGLKFSITKTKAMSFQKGIQVPNFTCGIRPLNGSQNTSILVSSLTKISPSQITSNTLSKESKLV